MVAQLDAFSRGLGRIGGSSRPACPRRFSELVEHSPVPVAIRCRRGAGPSVVEETVYFVASEALTNIARHANASRARLTLVDTGTQLDR